MMRPAIYCGLWFLKLLMRLIINACVVLQSQFKPPISQLTYVSKDSSKSICLNLLGVRVMSALSPPELPELQLLANSNFVGDGMLVKHHEDVQVLPASSRQLLPAGCRTIGLCWN